MQERLPCEFFLVVAVSFPSRGLTFYLFRLYSFALCQTQDKAILDATFRYIIDKSRDQDVVYFFRGFESNTFSRRAVGQFFKDNYDTVSCLESANVGLLVDTVSSCISDSRAISR